MGQDEYKVFTEDEIQFIINVLQEHGCYKLATDQTDLIVCPFWSWDEKDTDGNLGECICQHSKKFCVWLQTLIQDPSIKLVVRHRVDDDIVYEKDDDRQKITTDVKQIKKQLRVLQQRESELMKQLKFNK